MAGTETQLPAPDTVVFGTVAFGTAAPDIAKSDTLASKLALDRVVWPLVRGKAAAMSSRFVRLEPHKLAQDDDKAPADQQ